MIQSSTIIADPKLDLVLERIVEVPRRKVWAAWTTPAQLMQWFCPLPWSTVECEIDLRPGGVFRTTMQSPEGDSFPNVGCYLEVVPDEKLVWTDALLPGFRPSNRKAMAPGDIGYFTAVITLADHPSGTKYTATAIHKDADSRQKHEEMGFYEGWGTVLDQLVAMIKAEGKA